MINRKMGSRRLSEQRRKRKSKLSILDRCTLYIRNFLNRQTSQHKKNDDYHIGFAARRNSQNTDYYKTISILVIGCFAFVAFIWFLVHNIANISTSNEFNEIKISKHHKPEPISTPHSDQSDDALDEMLRSMKEYESIPFELKQSLQKSKMNELIHEHCIKKLPFSLDRDGHYTLNAHIQYALESLNDHRNLPNFEIESVAVSKDGTIFDKERKEGRQYEVEHIDYSHSCHLVTSIVKKAHHLKLNDPAMNAGFYVFAATNVQIWNERKDELFGSGNLNIDVFNLLSLTKQGNDALHEADELISGLLQLHCSNIFDFLRPKSEIDESFDPMMEMTQSVMSILKQINANGEIVLNDKSEIPAIDLFGHIVAVNEFNSDITKSTIRYNEHYATCPLIDKIVYYKNAIIDEQVENALKALKDSNIVSFENKMDILMEEHCNGMVRRLEATKAGYGDGSIYDSVFRGELLSFTTKVVENEFIGSNQFVVTSHGGIVHSDAALSNVFECKVIHQIAKHGNNANKAGNDAFDEHEFDPDFDDQLFGEEMDYIQEAQQAHSRHDADFDANLIYEHAMSDNHHNLRRIAMRLMYWYHAEDFADLNKDQIQKIMVEMEQFIVMLAIHELDIPYWPSNHVAFIDKKTASIKIAEVADEFEGDENKELHLKNGYIVSPLLNAIFRVFVENKNAKRHSIKDGLKQKREEMRRRRQENDDVEVETIDDSELKQYVELIWEDIKSQNDVNAMQYDIWRDLDEHCTELQQLSSYNVKKVKMNIMRIIKKIKSKQVSIENAVIVKDDGSIKSINDVDEAKHFVNCPYVAHLLSFKLN